MAITDVNILGKLASTAVAAYGDLVNAIGRNDQLENLLISGNAGFTPSQAAEFVKNYTLIDQLPNDDEGFSATVFRDNATGRYIFAARGTEMKGDVIQDLLIADIMQISPTGYAKSQAVSLYRYWKCLNTAPEKPVIYSELEIEQLSILSHGPLSYGTRGQDPALRSMLSLDTGTLRTGGGSSPLVPPDAVVDVTGHSLGGHLAMLFSRFFPENTADVVTLNAPGFFPGSAVLGLIGIAPFDDSKITRIEAEGDGISELGAPGFWPGTVVPIAQENKPGIIASIAVNHSSVNGNDALALMGVMARLSPNLLNKSAELSDFIRNASNIPADTYERALDALRLFVLGPDQMATTVSSGSSDATRGALYDNLFGLMQRDSEGNPTGAFASLQGRVEIAGVPTGLLDREDMLSYFAGLLALENLTPFMLKPTHADALTTLELANIELALQVDQDQIDATERLLNGSLNFTDNYLKDRAALLNAINLRNKTDLIQSFTLSNAAPTDRSWAFEWSSAAPLSSTYEISKFNLAQANYLFNTPQKIAFGDKSANSMSGTDEKLGDRLYGGAGDDIVNGMGGDDYLEGNAGDDQVIGGVGQDTLLGGAGADTLKGDAGADLQFGGAGADKLYGGVGNDVLYGGEGNDSLQGEDDNDFLDGGSGSDTLSGGIGNDYLFDQGGADVSTMNGDHGNDILEVKGGDGQTVLQGGEGNDFLIGGNRTNSLEGGEGNDLLLGGAGYDRLHGDAGADNLDGGAGSDALEGGAQSTQVKKFQQFF